MTAFDVCRVGTNGPAVICRQGFCGFLLPFGQHAQPLQSQPANAEGAARARSATEAFLYRRLETLSETAGKFRLNAELPISFDGWGHMEVDLLCELSKIAIELDGGQHLGDPDAYRRDRRKDALLQENGYLVLRFLAEDVGKNLDHVLDTILRGSSHQKGRS